MLQQPQMLVVSNYCYYATIQLLPLLLLLSPQ